MQTAHIKPSLIIEASLREDISHRQANSCVMRNHLKALDISCCDFIWPPGCATLVGIHTTRTIQLVR